MEMDSVIAGQRINNRRKRARADKALHSFIYAPENHLHRRKHAGSASADQSNHFVSGFLSFVRTPAPAARPAAGSAALTADTDTSFLRAASRRSLPGSVGRKLKPPKQPSAEKQRSSAKSLSFVTGAKPRLRLHFIPQTEAGRRITLQLLLGLSLLVTLGSALLFVFSPIPLVQRLPANLDMPADTEVQNFVLETLITHEAEANAEQAFSGELPVVLDTFSYRVQRNDTLDGLSRRFGIQVETLISLNNIRDVRRLQAGTVIKIPNIDGIVYAVKSGDSLSALATRYGSSVYELVDANDLRSNVLTPGQVLFIPGGRMSQTELKRALGTLVIWPLNGRISSVYGYRNSPITGIRQFHSGIDIVSSVNAPIKAAVDGRVAETGYSAVYGNFVILSHADGYQTLYAHLNRISVRSGQSVSQGATVGLLGSTGLSTGPHLHFGVYRNGQAMNPLIFLQGF